MLSPERKEGESLADYNERVRAAIDCGPTLPQAPPLIPRLKSVEESVSRIDEELSLFKQLASLRPPEANSEMVQMRRELAETRRTVSEINDSQVALREFIEQQGEEIRRLVSAIETRNVETPRRVTLADGRFFEILERDMFALCLGALVAARTGGAVDIPLTNGKTATALRLGELSSIAAQLLGQSE